MRTKRRCAAHRSSSPRAAPLPPTSPRVSTHRNTSQLIAPLRPTSQRIAALHIAPQRNATQGEQHETL